MNIPNVILRFAQNIKKTSQSLQHIYSMYHDAGNPERAISEPQHVLDSSFQLQ